MEKHIYEIICWYGAVARETVMGATANRKAFGKSGTKFVSLVLGLCWYWQLAELLKGRP